MTEELGFAEAFTAHVERRPDAPALLWQGESTTYGELFELAEKARAQLDHLDLQPREPIGVLVKKSPESVALILACLLARRPFLLPSPALAEQSLSLLFAQSGCRYVLAGDAEPRFAAGTSILKQDEDVSFMLTTSGSTGLPKIVPIGRGAVDRFAGWASDTFDIRPGTTVLNYAPLNFDLCLLDVWTTLARGGQVVLVDPDRAANGRYLLDLLMRHRVQVIQAVPMFFSLLLEAADAAGQRLPHAEHVMFTGDVMPERTLHELPRLFPTARLYNIYGCTETNDSFSYEVDPTSAVLPPVPIGEPLPGVHTLLVDDEGTVIEGSGEGELLVSTPFQTAGYLDTSRHTDKFVRQADGRCYFRSGDLVRRDAQGQLFLVGRSDFQVKVRGVAINTAEVERVLLEHPEVMEAAVVGRPDPVAGRLLVCAVQRSPQSRLNSLALKEHCARRLPAAAVPSMMRIVDEPLPKTSTGKVDRNAVNRLPELSVPQSVAAKGRTS